MSDQKMSERKKLSIEYVNRIKYERAEELDESLFAEVYYEGCMLVRKILKDNEDLKDCVPDKRFCTDEQFNNIVAFLGGRGMGKSSAVLSFALYLKEYERCKGKLALHTQKTLPKFYLLPRIDTAMMVSGENLLDIILAKMWDEFEEREKTKSSKDQDYEKVKEDFRKVKHSYTNYVNTMQVKESRCNMTSVRELHELAACLNLRLEFQQLVNDYLRFIGGDKKHSSTEFLVVTIDDLDVAIQDAYEILEQIRLFLMIPQIIVLVTADINRLLIECNKHFLKKLVVKHTMKKEKKQIRSYADNYLSKILPGNRRIDMPDLNGLGRVEYEVDVEKYRERLGIPRGVGEGSDGPLCMSEMKFLLVMLERYTEIMFDPYSHHSYFFQRESLRQTVNNLNGLARISEMEEEDWGRFAYSWLLKELKGYGDGMKKSSFQDTARKVMRSEKAVLNRTIIQELKSHIKMPRSLELWRLDGRDADNYLSNYLDDYEDDYGGIIKGLIHLDEIEQEELRNFVSMLFATQLSMARKDDGELQKHFRGNIFYAALENNSKRNEQIEIEKRWDDLTDLLSISFQKESGQSADMRKIFEANRETFFEVFKLANLCDVNLWNEGAKGYKKFTLKEMTSDSVDAFDQNAPRLERKEIGSEPSSKLQIAISLEHLVEGKVSMDYLFCHAGRFEENWEGFCKNIYNALCLFANKEFEVEEWKGIISEEGNAESSFSVCEKIKQWKGWQKEHEIRTVADILPLQSVDVICRMAMQMREGGDVSGITEESSNSTFITLNRRIGYIVKKLKDIEDYYMYAEDAVSGNQGDRHKMRRKRYSSIIREYLDEILELGKLAQEFAGRLDIAPSGQMYTESIK